MCFVLGHIKGIVDGVKQVRVNMENEQHSLRTKNCIKYCLLDSYYKSVPMEVCEVMEGVLNPICSLFGFLKTSGFLQKRVMSFTGD